MMMMMMMMMMMDISADLTELGRTPVCVVSAGVKSILDIGLTLEYLETQVTSAIADNYGVMTSRPRACVWRVWASPEPSPPFTPGTVATKLLTM